MPPRPTYGRSSSGRHRIRTAATARATAWTTRSGNRPGLTSRVDDTGIRGGPFPVDGPPAPLGCTVAAAVAARDRIARAAARLDDRLLPRGARRTVRLGVLEPRRVHRQDHARLDVVELRHDHPRPHLPADRLPHDLDGGGGDGHGRGDRVPVRVLHGADRLAADANDPVRPRPPAALVELPGPDLRVAADPEPRRRAQLVARQDRVA